MVLFLAQYFNDVWKSIDFGQTWNLITFNAMWTTRFGHGIVVIDNMVILFGGRGTSGYLRDVWKSIDIGSSWSSVTATASWSKRGEFGYTVMPSCVLDNIYNTIILVGGFTGSSSSGKSFRVVSFIIILFIHVRLLCRY